MAEVQRSPTGLNLPPWPEAEGKAGRRTRTALRNEDSDSDERMIQILQRYVFSPLLRIHNRRLCLTGPPSLVDLNNGVFTPDSPTLTVYLDLLSPCRALGKHLFLCLYRRRVHRSIPLARINTLSGGRPPRPLREHRSRQPATNQVVPSLSHQGTRIYQGPSSPSIHIDLEGRRGYCRDQNRTCPPFRYPAGSWVAGRPSMECLDADAGSS